MVFNNYFKKIFFLSMLGLLNGSTIYPIMYRYKVPLADIQEIDTTLEHITQKVINNLSSFCNDKQGFNIIKKIMRSLYWDSDVVNEQAYTDVTNLLQYIKNNFIELCTTKYGIPAIAYALDQYRFLDTRQNRTEEKYKQLNVLISEIKNKIADELPQLLSNEEIMQNFPELEKMVDEFFYDKDLKSKLKHSMKSWLHALDPESIQEDIKPAIDYCKKHTRKMGEAIKDTGVAIKEKVNSYFGKA